MSARQPGPYDCIAYKWLALLTRRQLYFMQLAESGRWKQYYTHAELENELHETVRLHDQWANIAGISQSERVAPTTQEMQKMQEHLEIPGTAIPQIDFTAS
jgi:hypothetical protein